MKSTPFDRAKLQRWDIRGRVPDDVIKTIDTPHPHEGDGHKPIWIIWSLRADCAPQIDTLCDTADSAVYHYGMIMEEISMATRDNRAAAVERVPANHRFASSIAYLFDGPIAYGKPRRRRT